MENFDIRKAGEAMIDAYFATLSQSGPELQKQIIIYVAGLVAGEKPYMWVTPDGIVRVVQQVFEDEDIRDFAFTLQFNFFLRWGRVKENFIELVNVLSYGCGAYSGDDKGDFRAIPGELSKHLATRESVQQLLNENPWLVCLLLLRSYATLIDTDRFQKLYGIEAKPNTTEL